MKLYRATDDPIARAGAHFTEEVKDAIAYTDNPGFGGPRVYEYKVAPRRHLDATGRSLLGLAEGYLENLDEDEREDLEWKVGRPSYLYEDEPWEVEARDVAEMWGDSGYYYVFHVLEHTRDVSDVLARSYDWVSFTDDFPPGSTTWLYLGNRKLKPGQMLHERKASPRNVASRWLLGR